ncbi:MAG TPA: asparagine synthase (glutamine-hydrolyzing) [Rhizomicrobium sp.]
MCGIFGWIAPMARAGERSMLCRLTDLLSYRGPDGAGYLIAATADGNYQIGLGHRRLSIIDIDGGVQPMQSTDGRIVLIYNGEIYNYIELRAELRALGHVFHSQSDSEVLIEAYRAWGASALGRLRGMFAFALWDADRQQLLLARDPFGKKPLFLAQMNGLLLFSSEIEPLLQYPGISRQVDPAAVDQYLLNRYVPGPNTFFRDIRKLQPGSSAIWHAGKLATTRYYTPPVANLSPDIREFEEATAALSDVFDEAVRIRMRSDAPYGAFLSGGIDSSAIVAAMSRHSDRVRTFSVGFRDGAFSELAYARDVAMRFGTEHSELVVDEDSFLEHWPAAIRHRGAPVSEASDIPILMLSQAAARSVKMVLTGEGADEMLGGYPKHRAEGWVALYQRLVPQRLHDRIVPPLARLLPYQARRAQILARILGERDTSLRMRAWFGSAFGLDRERLIGTSGILTPPDRLPVSMQNASPLRRMLYFDQTSWLPDNLLERGDRMMMAGSIEGRMPFMDTKLAAVAARIPDRFLVGGRGGKRVLRAALRSSLPSQILHRRKIGFRVPFHDWFRGPYRDILRDMLTSQDSRVAQICDASAVHGYLNAHLEGQQNNERILWTLVNLEMFLRTFKLEGLDGIADGRLAHSNSTRRTILSDAC